jgi:putative hydrolase of the HAD superfamily
MTAFDERAWIKAGLVPGAKETLDFLAMQGDELMLLTKGDYDIQRRKLIATGCNRWFGGISDERVQIVSRKDQEIFDKVVGDRDKSRIWAVGNSAKSDVIPALRAGLKVIYIPQESWAYEKHDHDDPILTDNPRLVTFDKIIRIKEKYDSLK